MKFLLGFAFLLVAGCTPLFAAPQAADNAPTLRYQWRLTAPQLRDGRFANLVEGAKAPATLAGEPAIAGEGAASAVILDGEKTSLPVAKIPALPLPHATISVSAWVLMERAQEWGAIFNALQDNGDFERGVALGIRGDRFMFAIASESAKRLTYLTADAAFEKGRWYHVAGTYDGKEMRLYIDGVLRGRSTAQSGKIAYPATGFIELAAYRDDNEYYRLRGLLHEVSVHEGALTEDAVARLAEAKKAADLPALPRERFGPYDVVEGPFVRCYPEGRARITWGTATPSTTELQLFAGDAAPALHRVERLSAAHAIELADLRDDIIYRFRIRGKPADGPELLTRLYRFDASFTYGNETIAPPAALPYPEDAWSPRYEALARRVLRRVLDGSGRRRGYCIVLGAEEGRLAFELARQSELDILALETDPENVQRARRALDRAGYYGTRVSVELLDDLSSLPLNPFVANLVVSDTYFRHGRLPTFSGELLPWLRPYGGVLHLESGKAAEAGGAKTDETKTGKVAADPELTAWLRGRGFDPAAGTGQGPTTWSFRRGPLEGAGEWTHQYGNATNAAYGNDELLSGDLDVLWFGRPGARPMPDRGPRNPAPLFSKGVLFVQGDRIFFGIDAYNGANLWSFQAPHFRRANVPRDCSNFAAGADAVYIAGGGHCYAVGSESGRFQRTFTTPEPTLDWGFVSVIDDVLIGSAVVREGRYIGDQGEWYEGADDVDVGKVLSQSLFAFDAASGKRLWLHDRGRAVNSTITADGERLYFVEHRGETTAGRARLGGSPPKEMHLVCLEIATGKQAWEVPFDFSKCHHMLYLTLGADTVIATGSDRGKNYHIYGFSTKNGYKLWEHTAPAKKTHHSGHLSHPVIIDDRVYVNNHIIDRQSGQVLRVDDFDYHGCGVMSASKHTIFHRFEYHGMWDLKTDTRRELLGLRSGCWLGMIPAGGLLLAPETSAGCSCTHAIQTSVAYLPRKLRVPEGE